MREAEKNVEGKIKDLFLGSNKHYLKFKDFQKEFFTSYDFPENNNPEINSEDI